MAEYIDRKSLIDEFDRLGLGEHSFVERVFSDGVRTIIAGIPAADVVSVVRCKDCTHTRKKDDYESIYLCDEVLICTSCEASGGGWLPVLPTHFCGYGCPRDGDDDA